MKKLTLILLLLTASAASYARCKNAPVSVISTKRDVFYFKVNKVLVGSTLEVYSSTGEMIFTAKVCHRKAIVDFYLENAGTYSIKLKKGDKVEEFTYVKESASPLVSVGMESASAEIVLAQ
jgi:hypothetical protein